MVLDYIRKGALCTLLGLGALVSPAIIPCNISSVYAQEQKENPPKQESRGLQELLSEEVKRLEEKDKTPYEYIRLAELYIDQKDFLFDTSVKSKLGTLLNSIKEKEGPEFAYLNLLLSEANGEDKKECSDYEQLINEANTSDKIRSKICVLYSIALAGKDNEKSDLMFRQALELDQNNISVYAGSFIAAYQKAALTFYKLPEAEKIKKALETMYEQEMHFNNALLLSSKMSLPLEAVLAKLKLYRTYSDFLQSTTKLCLKSISSKDKTAIQDRKKYVLDAIKYAQLAVGILPVPATYIAFNKICCDFATPGRDYMGEPTYLEQSEQLRVIDAAIKVCDEGRGLYAENADLYFAKGVALCIKAGIKTGIDAYHGGRLNSSAKSLCREALKNFELAVKYAKDAPSREASQGWIENLQKKVK